MGKYDLPLPEWAVPGAEVWLEPRTYGRSTKFRPAVVTRVTKSSVFIKAGESAVERRFVDPRRRGYGKNADEMYLREYGQRGSWASGEAFLHAKDSKHVAALYAASVVDDALLRAQSAANEFATGRINTTDRKLQADRLVEAVLSWKAALADLQPTKGEDG